MTLSRRIPFVGRRLRAARPSPCQGQPRRRSLLLERLEDRLVPSTLIPVPNHRDLVFDPARDLLYITTNAGTVQRYDVGGQQLLSPLNVGTALNGADITPDGSALYVTDSQTSSGNGSTCLARPARTAPCVAG
jgi:hypothetical protein